MFIVPVVLFRENHLQQSLSPDGSDHLKSGIQTVIQYFGMHSTGARQAHVYGARTLPPYTYPPTGTHMHPTQRPAHTQPMTSETRRGSGLHPAPSENPVSHCGLCMMREATSCQLHRGSINDPRAIHSGPPRPPRCCLFTSCACLLYQLTNPPPPTCPASRERCT